MSDSLRPAPVLARVLTFVSLLIVSSVAPAAVLFEPYAKYSMGTLETKQLAAGSEAKWKANGYGAGARLGFTGRHLFLVADYGAVLAGKGSSDTAANSDIDKVTETQLGVVVGLRFGFLRLFGGYDFTNDLSTETLGVKAKFSGHAIKAGLGFNLQPVALNVEFVQNTYDRIKTDTSDQSIKEAGYTDVKGTAIVVSLSVPLEFSN